MLFSQAKYEEIIDRFLKKYRNCCKSSWDKEILIKETSAKLVHLHCSAVDVIFAILFIRLYDNNLDDLKKDMAKVMLLDLDGVVEVDRLEVLKVFWWCLAGYLEHDASPIIEEINRRLGEK